MKTVVANTPAEKAKGLTGAPKGSMGIFDYMTPQAREFHRTDRDLNVFADGKHVGALTKDTPRLNVPPAKRIVEKPFQQGGAVDDYTTYTNAGQKGIDSGAYNSPKNYTADQWKSQQGMADFELPAGATGAVRYNVTDKTYTPGVKSFYSDPSGQYIYLPSFNKPAEPAPTTNTTTTSTTNTGTKQDPATLQEPFITTWTQEWVDDPSSPAGGYYKKVPVKNDYFTVKAFKNGGKTSLYNMLCQ